MTGNGCSVGGTYLRWQERLSENDSGGARDPRNPQNRGEPPLDHLQNGLHAPRTLNHGAVRQKHRDLNRSDDEQARGQHPQLHARSRSSGEESVHGFDEGVAQGGRDEAAEEGHFERFGVDFGAGEEAFEGSGHWMDFARWDSGEMSC